MSEAQHQIALRMEHVFEVGCSRCSNEGHFLADNITVAAGMALRGGWTWDAQHRRVFCPACNGEVRR
jgi:hypothetical protein